MLASRYGHSKCMQQLLEKGADINIQNKVCISCFCITMPVSSTACMVFIYVCLCMWEGRCLSVQCVICVVSGRGVNSCSKNHFPDIAPSSSSLLRGCCWCICFEITAEIGVYMSCSVLHICVSPCLLQLVQLISYQVSQLIYICVYEQGMYLCGKEQRVCVVGLLIGWL